MSEQDWARVLLAAMAVGQVVVRTMDLGFRRDLGDQFMATMFGCAFGLAGTAFAAGFVGLIRVAMGY